MGLVMKEKDYWLKKFLSEAVPKIVEVVKPARVVIFGSRARGAAGEGSDLDVIVVADSFRGMPFLKRMPFLPKLVQFEKHIDFLCYTQEEFERVKQTSSLVKSALREGMVVVDGVKSVAGEGHANDVGGARGPR
jgi:predicted nucleotidyltransferase